MVFSRKMDASPVGLRRLPHVVCDAHRLVRARAGQGDDWRLAEDVFECGGEPPPDLRQVNQAGWPDVVPQEYPVKWPFGSPRLP
jgi:hypothetical protein